MSDKINLTKYASKLYKKETYQLKRTLEFFTQENQTVDYNKILRNKSVNSFTSPIYDNERISNLKMVFK